MRFRMDPRAKLYLLLLANLMLFFHVSLAAEAIMAALFLLLFFLSGCYAAGLPADCPSTVCCWRWTYGPCPGPRTARFSMWWPSSR